jgi:hypothetical protein
VHNGIGTDLQLQNTVPQGEDNAVSLLLDSRDWIERGPLCWGERRLSPTPLVPIGMNSGFRLLTPARDRVAGLVSGLWRHLSLRFVTYITDCMCAES